MDQLLDGLLRELIKEFGHTMVAEKLEAMKASAPLEGQERIDVERMARAEYGSFDKIEAIKAIRARRVCSLIEAKRLMEATWPEQKIVFHNIR